MKKEDKVHGPLMLENLHQLMQTGKLDGTEQVSTDKENWDSIEEYLPEIKKFIKDKKKDRDWSEAYQNISTKTIFKVLTPFNVKMGPFSIEEMIKVIEKGSVKDNYEIEINGASIPFSRVKKRLPEKLEELYKIKRKEDRKLQEERKKKDLEMKQKMAKKSEPNIKIEKKDKPKIKKDPMEDFSGFEAVDMSALTDMGMENQEISYKESIRKLTEEDSQGLLSTKPLLSLFFTYALDNLSGYLVIERKGFEYKVTFLKGKIGYINTNNEEYSLFNYLKNIKNINVPPALQKIETDEMMIPQLIAMQLVEPSKIYDILKELLFYRLKFLMSLKNGKFHFETAAIPKNTTNMNINLLDRFWKIYSKFTQNDDIEKYVTQNEHYIIKKEDRRFKYLSYLKLGPAELKLVNKINGKVTTFQFLKALEGKGQYKDLFKKLIYLLFQLKFVVRGDLNEIRDNEEEIQKYEARLKEIEDDPNYFKILGVSETIKAEELRIIYLKFAREFHPDKLNREKNEKLKELKTSVYTWVSTAYSKLSTQEKIDKYREKVNSGPELDPETIFKAEEIFMRCQNAIKTGSYAVGRDLINEAISLVSDSPIYEIYRLYLNFVLDRDQSSINKLKDIMNDSKIPDGYRFLGRIYKILGNKGESKRYFQELLSIQPYDPEAKRETR